MCCQRVPSRELGRRRKEKIEFELPIEMTGQKAGAPLPRPMQLHLVEPHLHAIGFGMVRHGPFGRKQRQLTMMSAVFVEGLDDRHQASRWLSLISPRYNTGRCTTLPPEQRLLSTMLQ